MITMPNDYQHWGWLLVWSTNFRRCPLRSSYLSGREVFHHISAYLENKIFTVNMLLYTNFEIGAVFGRMPHSANMEFTLNVWIEPLLNWRYQTLEWFGIHQSPLDYYGSNWQYVIGIRWKRGRLPSWLRRGLGRFCCRCWLFWFQARWFCNLGCYC